RVKAIGQEVLQSLTPGHQVVKIIWEELRALMGQHQVGLALSSMPPTVIMVVGLQGAGKTTTCGKLSLHFKTNGKRVLLVAADAMIGQDAVTMAEQFDRRVGLTGVILTKTEGDARGGAVLSIKTVTGKPIKFLGTGEQLAALEPFHPDRMASRILGMGDVLSLIEKAQEVVDRDQAEAMARKLHADTLTLEDFRDQLKQVTKLGSLEQVLDMLPG